MRAVGPGHARQVGALADIGTRRERLARAGQHDAGHVVAVGQQVEHAGDFLAQLDVLRIHGRAVQRDDGHASVHGQSDGVEVHESLLVVIV
ncbi:hypothetical protein D3C71_1532810 [compost metagenome]